MSPSNGHGNDPKSDKSGGRRLRSRAWFDNPANPDMTAL